MRRIELGVFILAAVLPAVAAINQPVKVTGGLVSGLPGTDQSIAVFKGIPFAAPPVGGLRWRAPQPVAPWQGVRKADGFSASCVQSIVQERAPWTYEFMAHNEISEDCLHLNVWTPAKSVSDKLPVFVYIYGGGFREGSSAVPVYDGEGLARKGLVMVTISYRVGVLGYLAHPELTRESGHDASGNYGALDQVAALQWVRANIAAFGGDPNRVTIAGQSAGAISVHDLTASPLAKGLFHRAIAESGNSGIGNSGGGPMLAHRTRAEAEADGQRFAEAKGARSLAELRAMSWQTLTEPLPAAGNRGERSAGIRFAPIVDGYFLPASEMELVAQGKHNDVPMVTGANIDELGGISGPQGQLDRAAFQRMAQERYGAMTGEFLKLYPADTDKDVAAANLQSARDRSLVAMYLWAAQRARTSKTKTFLYLWDHPMPGPGAERFGAFHTSEVPYVLNTLYMSKRPFTAADHKIADAMSSYWANFAVSGDPNGKGLPPWAQAGDKPALMELGDKPGSIPVAADTAKFEFYKKILLK